MLRSELGQHLGTAYNNVDYFPDLEIVIISPHTNQNDVIHAHRCVLAARSPALRARLLDLAPGAPLNITTDKPAQLYSAFFKYPSLFPPSPLHPSFLFLLLILLFPLYPLSGFFFYLLSLLSGRARLMVLAQVHR